ncbi:MAG: MoxR family ATPase [Actinobacteria bacterium ATB1]|nr:MoxR family ATPase [Actinobacteria bacterium ATB1]
MSQLHPSTEFALTRLDAIIENVETRLQGKPDAIRLALVALVGRGHVLIEDVPGVGKTLLARSLAESLGCTWRRIQFTPDLLPSDLIGVNVFDPETRAFSFHPGPVFSNILLADEVNRASPKTQSALLEAMEESQVSVDGKTYGLREPFVVLATQNPLEHEGTYPLPESQLDRFLVRMSIGYPSREASLRMLEMHAESGEEMTSALSAIVGPEDVIALREVADACYVAPSIKEYVLDITESTRQVPEIDLGVSPRGSLHLLRACRAAAVLAGRHFVIPDDVKWVANAVLEHRIVLTPEAQMRGVQSAEVLAGVLHAVPVPVGQ